MQQLIAAGHRLSDIGDYTVDQFLAFLEAVERKEAVTRLAFVIDVSAAVGGMFNSKPLESHLDSLRSITEGE